MDYTAKLGDSAHAFITITVARVHCAGYVSLICIRHPIPAEQIDAYSVLGNGIHYGSLTDRIVVAPYAGIG